MTKKTDQYLREALEALVRFAGLPAVERALADLRSDDRGPRRTKTESSRKRSPRKGPQIPKVVNDLRASEPEKFEVLEPFFLAVAQRAVLSNLDDIRRFAEALGSKQLQGSTRRQLVSRLATALAETDASRLPELLDRARSLSAEDSAAGFSILTDRLLDTHED